MRNTVKTAVLLAALGGILVLGGGLVAGGTGAWIGLAIGLAFVGGSYWFSDTLALKAARARPGHRGRGPPSCTRSCVSCPSGPACPMPRVYVDARPAGQRLRDRPQPGPRRRGGHRGHPARPSTSASCGACSPTSSCTSRNRDILIGSVAAAVAMGITFIARLAMFGAHVRRRATTDDGGKPSALLAMALLAPVAAMLIQLSVSRTPRVRGRRRRRPPRRRRRAAGVARSRSSTVGRDHADGRQPGDGEQVHREPAVGRRPGRARGGAAGRLFSTHPPVEERIARLRAMHPEVAGVR